MKLPKHVTIAGRKMRVITDDKECRGGEWVSDPGWIKVGQHGSDEERINIFIHECLEAILTLRGHRYESYPEAYRFVLDHDEFTNFINDAYLAISDIIDPGVFSKRR